MKRKCRAFKIAQLLSRSYSKNIFMKSSYQEYYTHWNRYIHTHFKTGGAFTLILFKGKATLASFFNIMGLLQMSWRSISLENQIYRTCLRQQFFSFSQLHTTENMGYHIICRTDMLQICSKSWQSSWKRLTSATQDKSAVLVW